MASLNNVGDLKIGTTIPSTVSSNLSVTGNISASVSTSPLSLQGGGFGVIAQSVGTIYPSTVTVSSQYTTTSNNYNISAASPPSTIAFHNSSNTEIVRLNKDGSVTWNNEINIDAAAEAFCKSIQLGAERSAGITSGVKQRMRDTIFEEMIELAKIKGTLNADDLTYMLQAAKILDKLKGGYE